MTNDSSNVPHDDDARAARESTETRPLATSGDVSAREDATETPRRNLDPRAEQEAASEATTVQATSEDAPSSAASEPFDEARGASATTPIQVDEQQSGRGEGGALTPGSAFGPFTIVRYIGGGGMGRVYEGVDRDLERKVAIKVLPRKSARNEATVARFLNEAKSAARLNHENIAQVYLFGKVNNIPYIAFEFVEGVNLRDYVREHGALDVGEAIDYTLQSADALAHAASHGVTHRDVKPSNIILTPQKRAKLIDMGLARLLKTDVADDLTESGVTLGTFDYISPEQARDPRLADVRSDVYSLGCTLYFMLVGEPPFPNGTMLQKLLMHQGDEAPDVRESNPSIPFEVAAVVKKMMKKDPNERYQTPEALIADLRQIVDMLGIRVGSDRERRDHAAPTRRSSQRLRAIAPPLVAVLALLAVVAAMRYFPRGGDLVLPIPEPTPIANVVVDENETDANADSTGTKGDASGKNAGKAFPSDAESGAVATNLEPTRPESDVPLDATFESAEYVANAREYLQGATLERAPVALLDEPRDVLRNYLADGASLTPDERDAFGWRARALERGLATAGWSFDTYSAPLETSSRSITSYSFLPSSLERSETPTSTSEAPRVVDGRGSGMNAFATLQSAISYGSRDPSGVIRVELRFNGTLETPTISLVDKDVEIYAGEGYRPTLVFKPMEASSGGWSERMFQLDSSKLTIRGTNVDFTAPSQEFVASEWSVFEAIGDSTLALKDATVTVNNMTGTTFTAPLHSNVAFFRSKSNSNEYDTFDFDDELESATGAGFHAIFERAFARGEATLFVIERPRCEIEALDCLFNVSGSIVQYDDRRTIMFNEADSFSLRFDRVIALCRSSFVRIDATSGVWAPFSANVSDSIIRLNEAPLALVNSLAAPSADDFAEQWNFETTAIFDAVALWRRRGDRESTEDHPLPTETDALEVAKLADLNADAGKSLGNVSPHLFSGADVSNWLLNPIHTTTALSAGVKDAAETIKVNLIDKLVE